MGSSCDLTDSYNRNVLSQGNYHMRGLIIEQVLRDTLFSAVQLQRQVRLNAPSLACPAP